jgi:hypothetical protein
MRHHPTNAIRSCIHNTNARIFSESVSIAHVIMSELIVSELIVKVLEFDNTNATNTNNFDNTNATNTNKSDNTNATNTNKGGWGRGGFHGIYPYIGDPEIWRLLFLDRFQILLLLKSRTNSLLISQPKYQPGAGDGRGEGSNPLEIRTISDIWKFGDFPLGLFRD